MTKRPQASIFSQRKMVFGWQLPLTSFLCSLFLLACEKVDNGIQKIPQKESVAIQGTLPVRITPTTPTSADDLNAVFPNPGNVTYVWEKNGIVLDGENSCRLNKSHFDRHDKITAIVRKGSERGTATVEIGNALPKIVSASFIPSDISRGTDIEVTPVATDTDGDEIRFEYAWSINGLKANADTSVLKGELFKKGDKVSVTVIPSDSEGAGSPFKTKDITIPNGKPYFISTPLKEFKGNVYVYHAVAHDPDGEKITYSLVIAPNGMVIDSSSGLISWQVPAKIKGTQLIEVKATDLDEAEVSQRYSITIN